MFYAINIRKFYKFLIKIIILFLFVFLFFKSISYFFPLKYEDIIEKYSVQYSVDKSLIYAVINAESNFDENAISSKGASGLMQLMETTAIWIAEECGLQNFVFKEHIFIPEINIKLGTLYLSNLLEQYNNDEKLALAAYNAGTGNISKWLNNNEYSEDGVTLSNIPFKETKNYIKKVNFYKQIYHIIFKIREIFYK